MKKKIIIFVILGLSLVLLLGSIGFRPHIYDPNSPPKFRPCAYGRERILKYEVIVAPDPNALKTEVMKRLKQDRRWRPIGGISIGDDKYHQAMVMDHK